MAVWYGVLNTGSFLFSSLTMTFLPDERDDTSYWMLGGSVRL
jgi:hypothetical protein